MADFTLTIPDDQVVLVTDSIAYLFHYSDTLDDGSPNPQDKGAFALAQTIGWIKNCVSAAIQQQAQQQAVADAFQATQSLNISS